MRVARTQRRRWRDALAPWDLSPHQARALAVVSERDGVRLSDLAEALHIAPRSATEVADGLQERGLVERTPDPGDRRAVILRPTDEGRRVRAEIDAARAADASELFAPALARRPRHPRPHPAHPHRLTTAGPSALACAACER